MKQLAFTIALAFILAAGHSQIRSSILTGSSRQYEKSEWNVFLRARWTNPYLEEDVSLDMLLTTPSGRHLVLPCYFDSGESGSESTWKARFSPQEKGAYQYHFLLYEKGKPADSSARLSFTSKGAGKNKNGILHMKNNWTLAYDNGKPFRGVGENICWESRANDDSRFFKGLHENPRFNYEYMLPALAAHGGNFFRTWVCSWNLPLDWKRGFNSSRYTPSDSYFNPSAIAKIDRLMDLCDSLGLHVMLTLGPGAYNTREGGFSSSAADFFVNPLSRARYRNRLRYFVARWGYSPAIGAWEFFNEVDNVQFSNRNSPINPDDITGWHDEMSTYLKSLDPYQHVVTTSISHRDIKGLNALTNIDINQKHIYKNTSGMPAEILRYEKEYGKPYVIGEFSYEWDWSKDFNLFAAEMDSDFKRGLWYGLFTSTPVLPLSWWWEYFDDRGTDVYLKKVRSISDRMLKAGKGAFEMVKVDSIAGLRTYAVKCGRQLFVYVFNPSDAIIRTSLNIPVVNLRAKGNCYLPDTESWKRLTGISRKGSSMEIAGLDVPARSDMVLIIGE